MLPWTLKPILRGAVLPWMSKIGLGGAVLPWIFGLSCCAAQSIVRSFDPSFLSPLVVFDLEVVGWWCGCWSGVCGLVVGFCFAFAFLGPNHGGQWTTSPMALFLLYLRYNFTSCFQGCSLKSRALLAAAGNRLCGKRLVGERRAVWLA